MNDREWDKRLRIRTIGREEESDPHCAPYEPTPYAVLERLAASGYVHRKQHLVDYGCGKGRVVFFLASSIGCRVSGIDKSPKLIEFAKENRRSSRLGDRVQLFCCSAEKHALQDENAFFFFNPFSDMIFGCVLRNIVRSWQENPRTMTLFCYYPSEEYIRCLDDAPAIEQIGEIGCGDLFSRRNPRERIVVCRLPGSGDRR